VHDGNARVDVTDRRTEVEQRLAFTRSVPLVKGHGTAFELERRRDAVARLIAIAFERLRVRMWVDETRCDDEAGHVDGGRRGERRRTHRRDGAAANADMADGIEPRGRVHHAAVGEDEIERPGGLGRLSARAGQGNNSQQGGEDESVSLSKTSCLD
jgi:hypothetical protein